MVASSLIIGDMTLTDKMLIKLNNFCMNLSLIDSPNIQKHDQL